MRPTKSEWQSLLVAHYVEGCTIDALVSVNGTSRATLNRELKRAREAFRAALADGEGEAS
jgi:DNA-directed RNA polymerase specialized sigma24 family protein